MNDNTGQLEPDELDNMGRLVVTGAERLQKKATARRQFVAAGIAAVLVAGVAGAAFAVPLLDDSNVAGPSPTPVATATTASTPPPSPSPSPVREPPQFSLAQTESDLLPDGVAGEFDRATTRLVATDDAVRFFIARQAGVTSSYCLILVPLAGAEGYVAGCGPLTGLKVRGEAVGQARLGLPGSTPAGWQALTDFLSVDPGVPRVSPVSPPATQAPEAPYTVADVQIALDAIGPDVNVGTTPTAEAAGANAQRQAQTDYLAAEASSRLGARVALIRPAYVGFPDEQSGSPNSLLWWVTTSEPTGLAQSYNHQVNGADWTGWGQGDRDLTALQTRTTAWLAENYPGEQWIVLTQSQ